MQETPAQAGVSAFGGGGSGSPAESSSPRRRGSSVFAGRRWIPAFAGMTVALHEPFVGLVAWGRDER
ncbi:hypothetical protein FQY83_09555 [Luteimonas marina]|uniref:Uncharacterized protein n=1 Tax=Luteimonas marina TaxID=488485 RepID=A0A5C5U2L8_9GAMM|nr:hypothetical protein FQY83_09555 [Luteimonas marina]